MFYLLLTIPKHWLAYNLLCFVFSFRFFCWSYLRLVLCLCCCQCIGIGVCDVMGNSAFVRFNVSTLLYVISKIYRLSCRLIHSSYGMPIFSDSLPNCQTFCILTHQFEFSRCVHQFDSSVCLCVCGYVRCTIRSIFSKIDSSR